MPDETAASSTATEAPESQAPAVEETSIDFSQKTAPEPEGEESATSEATESEQDESVSAPEAAKPLEGSKAERRIRQLTAQVRALQRQQGQGPQMQQQPQFMPQPVRPKLDQYDIIEDYDKALDKYEGDSRMFAIQQDRVAQMQRSQAEAQTKQLSELRETWEKRSERITKVNPEFNVVEALGRIEPSPTMDSFFLDSEVGPELLDYLDTNPDDADRIRDMSPFKAVRELIKLEERLSLQMKGIKTQPSLVKVPGKASGRASAPAGPKTAADVLYG